MSTFLSAYKRGMDALVTLESAFSMGCMAFIIVINSLGIFSRYFLKRPVVWVNELTILIGTWLFYVGIGVLYARREDITLDLIVNKMPERMKRTTGLAIDVIVLIFLVLLAIYSYKLIPFVSMSGSMLSFSLGIRDVYYYLPVGIGAILIFIPMLYKTLKDIESYKKQGV